MGDETCTNQDPFSDTGLQKGARQKQTDHQSKYWLLHVNFLDIAFITPMKGTDSMEKYIQLLIQRLIFLVTCCTGGGVIHEI